MPTQEPMGFTVSSLPAVQELLGDELLMIVADGSNKRVRVDTLAAGLSASVVTPADLALKANQSDLVALQNLVDQGGSTGAGEPIDTSVFATKVELADLDNVINTATATYLDLYTQDINTQIGSLTERVDTIELNMPAPGLADAQAVIAEDVRKLILGKSVGKAPAAFESFRESGNIDVGFPVPMFLLDDPSFELVGDTLTVTTSLTSLFNKGFWMPSLDYSIFTSRVDMNDRDNVVTQPWDTAAPPPISTQVTGTSGQVVEIKVTVSTREAGTATMFSKTTLYTFP